MKLLTSALGFMALRTPHQANKLTMWLVLRIALLEASGSIGLSKRAWILETFLEANLIEDGWCLTSEMPVFLSLHVIPHVDL